MEHNEKNNYQAKGNRIRTIINGNSNHYTTSNKEEISKIKSLPGKISKSQTVSRTNNIKNKVIIIGDSHVRNCASILQENLSSDYKVTSFIKPGAQMSEITKTVK